MIEESRFALISEGKALNKYDGLIKLMWVSYSNVYGASVDLNEALKKIKMSLE